MCKYGLFLLTGETGKIIRMKCMLVETRLSVRLCVFADHAAETETARVRGTEDRGSCPQSNLQPEKSRIREVSRAPACACTSLPSRRHTKHSLHAAVCVCVFV